MAIRFCNDRIVLGTYTLAANTGGAAIGGTIFAKEGFCEVRLSPVQGTISGYTSGGGTGPYPSPVVDTIDKFPFSSDTPANDVGELTQGKYDLAGQSSSVSGYSTGGMTGGYPSPVVDTIEKHPFSSDAPATDVGEMIELRYSMGGGQSSTVSGYTSGGYVYPAQTPTNTIDKFPFSSDTSASDVGEITVARYYAATQSSIESGYMAGGRISPANTDAIDKFPFSSDTPATDVGEITSARYGAAGQSSKISGYMAGGRAPPVDTDAIEKFPFATDANSTDVSELTACKHRGTGQSSDASGYFSGGYGSIDTIEKFPFAVDSPGTDVGELISARHGGAGQQV